MTDEAPGWPGLAPRWTSSAKTGIGTALTAESRVWFALSHGILNEIYFPRTDRACTRDLGLIVTDGKGFFSEEKRHALHEFRWMEMGIPAFELVNTCPEGRYRITKQIIADPRRDVVLQFTRFEALRGAVDDYRLFALLAPHLVNGGSHNTAWVGDHKGEPMLFAEGDGSALALACSAPFIERSVGFVGTSDGWQQLSHDFQLAECYGRAENGNVAMTAEIDIRAAAEGAVVAVGFGYRAAEAAHRARASLQDGFDRALALYLASWRHCQGEASAVGMKRRAAPRGGGLDLYPISVAVMLAHEPMSYPGAIIASLSIPWGSEKGDDDLGGYHLVWPRDLVETAGGLLAAGLNDAALRVLDYLQATQNGDGSWPQNMWLDGTPYWGGVQLDECAFPILLVDLLRRVGALDEVSIARYLPMVRTAAGFVLVNGPVTGQDRWEEDSGYSPFTLAVSIAAFLAAADLLEADDSAQAAYLRETADAWNDGVERWTFVRDTPLARECGVEGYYVRIAPPDTSEGASPAEGFVAIKNRPLDHSSWAAQEIVSPDALALVRFGLRAAADPRIRDTVTVIDRLLRIELPRGAVWRRYNEDGYGEHADGSAFDGEGIGRGWPLLTGERALYELALGDVAEARRLLDAFCACASDGGLLPEQVWDADDIPGLELYRGRPTGSAMPLVWAHAEHVKLLRSLRDGRVFDMPPQTVRRYQHDAVTSPRTLWRPNHRCRSIGQGLVLRVELPAPTRVAWRADDGEWEAMIPTKDSGFGLHYADLPTAWLPPGTHVGFRWDGGNSEETVIIAWADQPKD